MISKQFHLVWNKFQINTTSFFKEMREDQDFTDVTLCCEENKQIMAHKAILAASSPFFKTMLKQNNHPQPIIYLRGVKSQYLEYLIDFVYQGEINILEEELEEFLALAEDLEVKGLGSLDTEVKEDIEKLKNNKNISEKTMKTISNMRSRLNL